MGWLVNGKSVFFVVWSFLLFGLFGCYFFAVWAGACFFCCLGGGPGPAQTEKKNTPPPKQQKKKKKNAPAPSERVFFCCLGGWVCLFFCCLGGGRVFFGGRVLFFAVWAGACSFFAVWAEACSFFCCLGRGLFFLAVWAGDGSSLTHLSAWLVFKRPNNKRDRTAKKKKHGFPTC